MGTLERFSLPYSVHKVIPFVGELEPVPVLQAPKAICFGSYSMRHFAKANSCNPGIYDLFDQDFHKQLSAWGAHMLNADSQVCAFKDARLTGPTFMRPIDDSKYFAGRVFDVEEFVRWQRQVCELGADDGTSLTPDMQVQLCHPKTIYAEYRFWIVCGEIVTASLYKLGRRVTYSSEVDERIYQFVRAMIAIWQPHRAL